MFLKSKKIIQLCAAVLTFSSINIQPALAPQTDHAQDAGDNTVCIPVNTTSGDVFMVDVERSRRKLININNVRNAIAKLTKVPSASQLLTIGDGRRCYYEERIDDVEEKELTLGLEFDTPIQDQVALNRFILDLRTKALENVDWHGNDEAIMALLKRRVESAEAAVGITQQIEKYTHR